MSGVRSCLSARKKMSISGYKRTCPGLKLAAYTWNCWGKGVTESAGISLLEVQLELEGELGLLSYFSPAVCSAHGGITLQRFPSSSSATVPCGFYLMPEPTTDFFLMVCIYVGESRSTAGVNQHSSQSFIRAKSGSAGGGSGPCYFHY